MPRIEAVLVDVYDTALTCDFSAHDVELPKLAGIPADIWRTMADARVRDVMDGRLGLTQVFAELIESTGQAASAELLQRLLQRDAELLVTGTTVYDDTIPFLERARANGIRTAFVSNCAENTRGLLEHFGLADLADTLVLSCEAGYSKPAPEIYRLALAQLGVTATAALLVDDQERYCDGAKAVGMGAVRIARRGPAGPAAVTSLLDVERILD